MNAGDVNTIVGIPTYGASGTIAALPSKAPAAAAQSDQDLGAACASGACQDIATVAETAATAATPSSLPTTFFPKVWFFTNNLPFSFSEIA